jgi:hypothetical protein
MSAFPSDNVEDVGEIDDTIAAMIELEETRLKRKLTKKELKEIVSSLTPEDQDDYEGDGGYFPETEA